jgi:hypothetical protein
MGAAKYGPLPDTASALPIREERTAAFADVIDFNLASSSD